jgi:divalent metal cation (Fe/Co/Zn/Cd) transporter
LLVEAAHSTADSTNEVLLGLSLRRARRPALEAAFRTVAASPSGESVLSIYAVHVAPQEAIVAAKVHPSPGQTGEQLPLAMDDLDRALREELPEVAEVFIDVTSHSP